MSREDSNKHQTLAERLWERVQKTSSCWLWFGSHNGKGYGQLHVSTPEAQRGPDGRSGRKIVLAHRLSWELANGPIPDGMEVCHNCPEGDNPRCVNPAHLFLGTHNDNMKDAGFKGQMPRGVRRPTAKLTDDLVRAIRHRYTAGGITQQALADEIGVSISQICGVVNRTSWRHVE